MIRAKYPLQRNKSLTGKKYTRQAKGGVAFVALSQEYPPAKF
jgi:hypothetical protein